MQDIPDTAGAMPEEVVVLKPTALYPLLSVTLTVGVAS